MTDKADKDTTLPCVVYRGRRRDDSYLFVEKHEDFSRVPEALLKMLGGVDFVMDLELWPGRALAQASCADVMRQLREQGYFLQMPRRPGDPLM